MRIAYLTFFLILVLGGVGAWVLSSRPAPSTPEPIISTTTPSTQKPAEKDSTTASLTQTIVINGIRITPLVVVEDSRCPVDVQCIQAGTVRVQARLGSQDKVETLTITLGKQSSFEGVSIKLEGVLPTKYSKTSISPSDYRFTFSVANATTGTGTLSGTMTLGPICPVEQAGNPCKPTAEMYAARKVNVYASNKTTLVASLVPKADGTFSATFPAGSYYIAMAETSSVGRTSGVPITIKIEKGLTTHLSIDIDTGIR